MKRSLALAGLVGLALSTAACEEEATVPTTPVESTALMKKNKDTFITDKAAKLDLLVGGQLTPIANAGETMPGGEVLVGIPDGLGAFGGRYLNLFMNHEISASAGETASATARLTGSRFIVITASASSPTDG